jgi:hypothetical protein
MKNLILPLLMLVAGTFVRAQSTFKFQQTSYVGALSAGAAEDWTKTWTEWNPKTAAYAAPTDVTTLDGTAAGLPVPGELNITGNLTLDAGKVYLLKGVIVVRSGGKLTIPAGTLIRCEGNINANPKNYATLLVERGGQIFIQGTKDKPVVFTSSKNTNRERGDWGGLVVCGRARNNQLNGTTNDNVQLEGFNNITFDNVLARHGGTDDNDNSGSIAYCRIEFAGFAFEANREINGLTLGSVGAETVLHHIQVSYGGDDAFEWFGGKVNSSYLISYKTTDDDFDTDFGYSGWSQFGLGVRDTAYYDLSYNATSGASTSEGFESDNEATGTASVRPYTKGIFSNYTMIGPVPVGAKYTDLNSVSRAAFRRGVRLRRNSSQSIVNSIFMGYRNFLMIDGDSCVRNTNFPAALATVTPGTAVDQTLKQIYFANNLIVNTAAAFVSSTDTTANGLVEVARARGSAAKLAAIDGWVRQSGPLANNINPVAFTTGTVLVNPLAASPTPDFRPVSGSPALTGANFKNNPLLGGIVPIQEVAQSKMAPVFPNPVITGGLLYFGKSVKEAFLINGQGQIVRTANEASQISTEGIEKGLYFIYLDGKIQKVLVL